MDIISTVIATRNIDIKVQVQKRQLGPILSSAGTVSVKQNFGRSGFSTPFLLNFVLFRFPPLIDRS